MATTNAEPKATTPLPSPEERPGADVVIYDGQCRICTAQVQRLARFDGGQRLAYLSLHDPEVAQRYPDLSYDDMMAAMYVVDQQDGRHRGGRRGAVPLAKVAPAVVAGPADAHPFLDAAVAVDVLPGGHRRYKFGRIEEACDGGTCHLHGH